MCGMTYFKRTNLVLSISAINTVKAEKILRQWPKFFHFSEFFVINWNRWENQLTFFFFLWFTAVTFAPIFDNAT